jgi:ribose 5-phosphate isomerase RpiB
MNIAVVTEVSTVEKNKFIMDAVSGLGHSVSNLGMIGSEGETELTYIHTGFISALLINSGVVDFVIAGCGTGQGFMNSVLQYPRIFCGLIESPLDAWLFQKINGGNCISLALNKGFGWAGNVNLQFIFQHLFAAKPGEGYPESRRVSQGQSRDLLKSVSTATHCSMLDIIDKLPVDLVSTAIQFPGIMGVLRKTSDKSLIQACEKYLHIGI